MTQEDKELLLKDISARILYGLKCNCGGNTYNILGVYYTLNDEMEWEYMVRLNGFAEPVSITSIKPYLRPMSSMTKKERKEYDTLIKNIYYGYNGFHDAITVDYLNSIHVDYRGLIEKGLAIKVTEENNPYKTE